MTKLTESTNNDIATNTKQVVAMEETKIQIFQAADGVVRLEDTPDQDTVWLNQRQMAALFDKDGTANEHIRKLLDEGELAPKATVRELRTVRVEVER